MKNPLLILFFFLPFFGFSQSTATIKGKLIDEFGFTVRNANISISGTETGTTTDSLGKFNLTVPANEEFKLRFSHAAYKTKTLKYKLAPNQVKVILPVFKYRVLPAHIVKSRRINETVLELENIDFDGAATTGDFLVRMGQEIGATKNSELGSGYNVRGGNFEENLIYVNDVEIYRPFLARSGEQEGLSFINSSMVENIQFSAGGFQSKYGDKLSSVLDIRYKKPTKFGGSVYASLLGVNAHVEGISENQLWTQISAVRLRSNRYLFGALDTKGEYRPFFGDFQPYITYTPSENWEHSFLGNYALNRYQVVPENRETNFGTIQQALRLTIFFEGQEVTDFETYFGAITNTFKPKPNLELKLITSAFRSFETETFDILGQYFIDELERDLSRDNFGDVAFNRGIGSYLNHARNYLDASVANVQHRGKLIKENGTYEWGVKFQHEKIEDRLSEWDLIDSAGYSIPQASSTPGVAPNGQQELRLFNSFKAIPVPLTTALKGSSAT